MPQVQPISITKCEDLTPVSPRTSANFSPAKKMNNPTSSKKPTKIYEGYEVKVMRGGAKSPAKEEPQSPSQNENSLKDSPMNLLTSNTIQESAKNAACKPTVTKQFKLVPAPRAKSPLVSKLPPVVYQSPYKTPRFDGSTLKPTNKENAPPGIR